MKNSRSSKDIRKKSRRSNLGSELVLMEEQQSSSSRRLEVETMSPIVKSASSSSSRLKVIDMENFANLVERVKEEEDGEGEGEGGGGSLKIDD